MAVSCIYRAPCECTQTKKPDATQNDKPQPKCLDTNGIKRAAITSLSVIPHIYYSRNGPRGTADWRLERGAPRDRGPRRRQDPRSGRNSARIPGAHVRIPDELRPLEVVEKGPGMKGANSSSIGDRGKRFDYLTIDNDDNYLLSAHLAAGHYVIDLATNKVVATVTDTPGVEGVEYVPELKVGVGHLLCGTAGAACTEAPARVLEQQRDWCVRKSRGGHTGSILQRAKRNGNLFGTSHEIV